MSRVNWAAAWRRRAPTQQRRTRSADNSFNFKTPLRGFSHWQGKLIAAMHLHLHSRKVALRVFFVIFVIVWWFADLQFIVLLTPLVNLSISLVTNIPNFLWSQAATFSLLYIITDWISWDFGQLAGHNKPWALGNWVMRVFHTFCAVYRLNKLAKWIRKIKGRCINTENIC